MDGFYFGKRIGIKSEEMLREEQKEVNKEGSGKEVTFTSI